MDASLPGGCSAQEVPLQEEALGSTDFGNLIGKQSSLDILKLHTTGAPIVEPTKIVEVHRADGNSKTPILLSPGGTNEGSRLVSSDLLGSNVVSVFQNSDPGEHEVWKKGNGLSVKRNSIVNGTQKGEEERNGHKSVVKDAPQVRTESQLPMRQLARKGGLLKGDAACAPKAVLSVADAVKEGILKKERQQQERKDALEAVMAIHGRRKETTGHAALFPGVTGPESGRLCQRCSRPETLKSTIFCDKCERGFHVDCVKHWPKPPQEFDVWHCVPCGLQPGHYWPLGRVLISYDDAVAEYKKYSSTFLTSLQRKDESGFGSFPLGLDQKTHEKSNGLDGSATKVKIIRDFKKEARKGTSKGSVAITATQPAVSMPGYVTPLDAKESGTMIGIQAQSKTLDFAGYVPMQPKSVLNSVAPIVNFIVPPESSVVMTLPSTEAHVSAKSQSIPLFPATEYLMSSASGSTYTGSISTHLTSTKLPYTASKDSPNLTALSSQSEITPSGSQYRNTSVINQFVSSPLPSATGPSNLSSGTNQINFQQNIPSASGTIGLEVSSTEDLRPFVLGERLTEREELLRDAKESLNQLRTFISGLKGNLPEDWRVILRRRPTGIQEKFYLSPAKRKYRSRQDVARFLGLVNDPRCQKIKSSIPETSIDKLLGTNKISPAAIQAIEMRSLPIFFGDVMIEKLGVIDPRPTYSNEHLIWPVKFRSSWHDPETGSYCISEVEDGGDLGPIFRVTRKLVIGPANNDEDLLAPSSLGKSALTVGGITGEAGKIKSSEEKSSPVKSVLGGTKLGGSSVYTLPAEGSKGYPQKQYTEGGNGDISKHPDNLEGHKEADYQKDRIILLGKGHEGESTTTNIDALSKSHVVAKHSVGQAVVDLTAEKESSEELRSGTKLEVWVPALDVNSDVTKCAGNDVGALGNVRADNQHAEPSHVVIDLSDEEDEKPSALVSRDKGPGPGVGFLPPPVKPLPNILMEEFTVEARTPGEAWKLFSKQFVEHCKKSLRSGINCTVPILEATNDYVIYHSRASNLKDEGIGIANSALLRQESIDRRETTKALLYEKLGKRLGEDRFGLNIPEVQKMIKALHPGKSAGNAKAWVKGVDQIVEAARNAALLSPSMKDNAVNASGPWKRRKRKNKADVAAEESFKKMKPLEPVAPHQPKLGAGGQLVIENVVFQNAPAAVVPLSAPVPAIGSVRSYAPTMKTVPVPPPVIIIDEPRQLPPPGQPILKRLPSEMVGDLIQVWEFLCRFSDLFGHDLHCTLEDLEAGLMDVAPARAGPDVSTEIKDSSKHSGEKGNVGAVVVSSLQTGTTGRGDPRSVIDLESLDKDLIEGNKVSDKSVNAVDIGQGNLKVCDLGQDTDLNTSGETQAGITSSPSPCIEDAERKEMSSGDSKCQENESKNLTASQRGQSETENTVVFSDGGLGKGLASLAEAHIPLLKFLVSDLKFRVSRSLNEDDADEPKKRGRKRLCDIGALPPELGDDLPMNAISWPEVAHRYLVAILDVKKLSEISELAPEERKKLVRYFEGDGGVMGGAVDGVVGVESDAQVLAEAEKELTLRMPKTIEKDIVIFVPQQWDVALTPINPAPKKTKGGKTGELPEVLPKWVEELEPVRKMPTNLGTKLKNQVQVALDCNPPDWAKATLEWSLSKGTFKSNAAGTTKRAVLEVLAQYHGEELKAINAPRVRKVKAAPSAEHLMQRCRIVLREVAKADSKQVFSNLVGGAFPVTSGKDVDTLARPLDFRTIDARLAAGAYGGSTDAFAADMRQVWKNVEEVHTSGSAILELASSLSQLFEKLYLKQVISLIKGVSETRDREKEKAIDMDSKVDGSGKKPLSKAGTKVPGNATDDKLGKAPWEDDTTCRVCGIDEDYDSILLCDGCDAEYHIYCLVPPLEKVPKGNWFCPSCVAVEEGFPEAPPLGEAELAALQEEMERPVAGSILKLEYEDEKMPSGRKPEPEKTVRVLRSGTKSEVGVEDDTLQEDFDSQPPAVESNVEVLLRELEKKEYWQLSLSDKIFLLKFLCDEALKTPQVRSHLEKSVEVAQELQQQLRDLVAERLKIVMPVDTPNHAKPAYTESLLKPHTTPQQGPSLDAMHIRDGVIAVAPASRSELHVSEGADLTKAAKIASPLPRNDNGSVLVGDSMPEMKTQESIVGLDLDLNVVAGKEPETDQLPPDHKVSSGTSPVKTSKERLLVEGLDSIKRDGNNDSIIFESRNFATMNTGNGIVHLSSVNEKLGPHQDPEQRVSEEDLNSIESKSGHIHVTSVAEGGDGDIPIQADAAPRPLNPLKRNFERTTSGLPSSDTNGPENLKKTKNKEIDKITPSGVTGAESNDSTPRPSDGHATAGTVLEDKDARPTALQSARDLDVRIAKLGAKLFNLTLRREHMGTDHLGREYWALTGIDGRPCLVVADSTSASQDQTGTEGKRNDDLDLKTVHEETKWIYYRGDKALDELVKWLSPRDQQERVLRIAIYHWRRSLSSRHLLDMPEIMTALNDAGVSTTMEPSKVADESRAVKEIPVREETEENRIIRSFPSVKATRLLLRRYAAPNASGSCVMSDPNQLSTQKEILYQNDSVLKRCHCLELIWTLRHHCQTCHETYESTAEFQAHLNDCPPGSKTSPENVSKEIQPQIPPKSKKTKKLSSFDTPPDLHHTTTKAGSAPRSERTRRGLKRGGSQPAVDEDVDMEPVESMELLSEYVESLQVQKIPEVQASVEDTPSNGLLKALEDLIEPSSPKVMSQPPEQPMKTTQEPRGENENSATTFSGNDWDANTQPTKFGAENRNQVAGDNELHKPEALSANQLNCSNNLQIGQGNTGRWVDDLNISKENVRGHDLIASQLNCSSNPQGGQGNSGGWVNDLNISDQPFRDQELYLRQANCASVPQNGQGNSGGWMNDLNISNQSFTDQVLESNRLDCSNTAHGNHGNSGGWANDLNVANQSFREDAPASFGYHPPAPSMISTPQSSQERIIQIGFSDQGRSFAPPVQNPLAFDSARLIPSSPEYPSLEGFPSLESSNPAASQYQQLIPSHNPLTHTPVANTNFLLSLSDTNSKPVPYNQYLSPSDHANPQQLGFQQMLSSHDTLNASSSLYPSFLPSPENVNTTHLSYPNLLHSRDSRNPQPVLYSQYNPPLENINLNTTINSPVSPFPNLNYTNPSAVPYVNLNSNFSPSGSRHTNLNIYSNPSLHSILNSNLNPHSNPSSSRHAKSNLHSSPLFANFNTNSNPSVPHHTSLNANSTPLFTSLNVSNPAAPSFAHFPINSNLGDPETKKFDVGRFNSNSWFDSQSPAEPLTLERPAVIPTKPTARRTSTWDYLINLPLPSSQENERSVQRHPAGAPGDQSSPPPLEVGPLPFDLMFEKPQREHTASADNGALALDPMFEGQQIESQTPNSTGDAASMRAASVTLDFMLEKHGQEHGVPPEATGANEVGSLSIDLMSVPEEHIDILQAEETMGTAEETCIESEHVEPSEAVKETCSGDVQDDCTEAATGLCEDKIQVNCSEAAAGAREDNVQIDCSEAAKESCQASAQVDPGDACVEDVLAEVQGEAEVGGVEVKQGEAIASSEPRISSPPHVPVVNTSSGRKPVKRFPVIEASVRPLVGEQKDLLKELQISLLDMEAALATDVLESSRALPVRRRAWRAFVKAASCIYEVTKAIILLELMVKAECLKSYWGLWSSLSAAARSSSLSSLALRLFALDGAITYESVKAPEDGKETVTSSKSLKYKKKKSLDLPLPPPAKKKKKK